MNLNIADLIYIVLALPVIFSVASATNLLGRNLLHWMNRVFATAVGAAIVMLVMTFDPDIPYIGEYIYLDKIWCYC